MAAAPGSQAGRSGLDRLDSSGAAFMPTSASLDGETPSHCRMVTHQSEPRPSRPHDGSPRS
eukprot:2678050-Heterocapsa_arctica.AAC.1